MGDGPQPDCGGAGENATGDSGRDRDGDVDGWSGGDDPLDEAVIREIYRSANDAIFVHDAETGEILDVNETMCEMYGYDRREARQLTVEDISSGTPPYTGAEALEYVQRAAEGEPQMFDWRARDSDGDLFWVEIRMRRASVGDEAVVLASARDVTERKAYERRLEEQRDRLDILNQMVRHDFRNELQMVSAYAEMLEERLDGEAGEMAAKIGTHVDNAVELTTTARDLSETMLRDDSERDPVSLRGALVPEVEDLRSAYEGATISIEGTVPAVDVLADGMLGSVFRNLLRNAVQHNDKEVPEVRVSATEDEDSVVVRVADNGPGIPDDRKESVFGKGERGLDSPGTGLGLYLASTLVEQYGGEIWIEDGDPEGAVFAVELATV